MRSHLKILMVVGLLALMMPLLLGYLAGPSAATHPNTTGDHATSKTMTNSTCSGCHDPNAWYNSSVASNAHRRHFLSAFLNFATNNPDVDKGCGRCHEESIYGGNAYEANKSYAGMGSGLEGDLSYTDNNAPSTAAFTRVARKQVKADVCQSCHGQFNKDAVGHGGVNLAQTNPNGCVVSPSGCHTSAGTGGDPTVVHDAATYINQNYANSTVYCSRCHGGLAWYQTTETSATLP